MSSVPNFLASHADSQLLNRTVHYLRSQAFMEYLLCAVSLAGTVLHTVPPCNVEKGAQSQIPDSASDVVNSLYL